MIVVRAPAHLHAGNFDLTGDLGRLYGTVGFAINYPLEVEVHKCDGIEVSDAWAYEYAKRLIERFDLKGLKIDIRRSIPRLVGLGYNTTLALSIGLAASKLYDLNLSIEEVALIVQRGTITALGVYALKVGGFIVEGGFKIDKREKMVPPLIFHRTIPEDWYFIVAIPYKPREHIMREREREDDVLKELKVMPREMSSELSRIVLMKIIPSIIEGDLKSFGEGLTLFNAILGDFWREYQGGRYCHSIVEEGINLLLSKAYCACQSSWGPAFYGIVKGEKKASALARELKDFIEAKGGGEVFYVKPDNQGAIIMEE
ncbi:MAG: GHMP kinase [Halobacteria archaeon]